jgi:soluble lytic murein transglycosylase-like protein
MGIPYLACMLAVSAQLGLPPRVLPTIQAVEGGQVGMARTNANGTEDFGLMQVNSIWLEPLSKRTGLSRETLRTRLIDDGCFSIAVAGAILRVYLHETRGNLLAAIGNYHSHTPVRHTEYRLKVIGAATRMFANPTAQRADSASRR